MKRPPGLLFTYEKEPEPTMENFREPRSSRSVKKKSAGIIFLWSFSDEIRIRDMKKYICLLAGAALLAGCEQKETTVTNPPAEKKEGSNYEEKKDGTYELTVKNTPPAETTTKEKTEVNVNTSPNPSP